MGIDFSSTVLYIAALLLLFVVGFFVIPNILLKRAVSQVIRIFRQHHCLCPHGSKTVEELGLKPPGLVDRMLKTRDYKPYALQMLIKTGVVRQTEDQRLCLSEEKLAEFSARR